MAIFRCDSLKWASNTGRVGTIRVIFRDSGRMAGYRSMTPAVRDQQLTVFRAVGYPSYGARLFMVPVRILR